MLTNKHIVVGISGSIAAYKTCLLIRGLIKEGALVQVVITPAGKNFITPTTLAALTSKPVISEFFDKKDGEWHSHVDLGQWADLMIIAPATASTIGKMANGIADNMLITTYLSMKAPVFIAPAMDLDMYNHPSTKHNIEILKSYGNYIIDATLGELASHIVGKGRMQEPEAILEEIKQFLKKRQDLIGKSIVITAGPTYEAIDPVRFIGNNSSGKMGFSLAQECANRGAKVTLISGPVNLTISHPNINIIDVTSAQEMNDATVKCFSTKDIGILCAAVADFTPEMKAVNKIKSGKESLNIKLKPTKDIAFELGQMKQVHQHLIGFALETNDEIQNAQKKLKKKNLDFIVLNSLKNKGAGFKYDTNKISIISDKERKDFPLKSKTEVAKDIIDYLCDTILLS